MSELFTSPIVGHQLYSRLLTRPGALLPSSTKLSISSRNCWCVYKKNHGGNKQQKKIRK